MNLSPRSTARPTHLLYGVAGAFLLFGILPMPVRIAIERPARQLRAGVQSSGGGRTQGCAASGITTADSASDSSLCAGNPAPSGPRSRPHRHRPIAVLDIPIALLPGDDCGTVEGRLPAARIASRTVRTGRGPPAL